MSWQAFPFWPQISQWYWKVIGRLPDQLPGFAVSVDPVVALPLIVGPEVFEGAAAARVPFAEATPTTIAPARHTTARKRPKLQRLRLGRTVARFMLTSRVFWFANAVTRSR